MGVGGQPAGQGRLWLSALPTLARWVTKRLCNAASQGCRSLSSLPFRAAQTSRWLPGGSSCRLDGALLGGGAVLLALR